MPPRWSSTCSTAAACSPSRAADGAGDAGPWLKSSDRRRLPQRQERLRPGLAESLPAQPRSSSPPARVDRRRDRRRIEQHRAGPPRPRLGNRRGTTRPGRRAPPPRAVRRAAGRLRDAVDQQSDVPRPSATAARWTKPTWPSTAGEVLDAAAACRGTVMFVTQRSRHGHRARKTPRPGAIATWSAGPTR